MFPGALVVGSEPYQAWECAADALHPDCPGFSVPVYDAASGLQDLVWTHRRITDEDHPIVMAVGAQNLRGRGYDRQAPSVVLPHVLVDEIVKVEVLEMFELATRSRKHLLAGAHVIVH